MESGENDGYTYLGFAWDNYQEHLAELENLNLTEDEKQKAIDRLFQIMVLRSEIANCERRLNEGRMYALLSDMFQVMCANSRYKLDFYEGLVKENADLTNIEAIAALKTKLAEKIPEHGEWRKEQGLED